MTTSLRSAYTLDHVIDAIAVEEFRAHIRGMTTAPRRLDLNCATVQAVDPVGASLLWLLCTELARREGTRIRLVNLPVPVGQKLRSHPLSLYRVYGDELFQDPFYSPSASNR